MNNLIYLPIIAFIVSLIIGWMLKYSHHRGQLYALSFIDKRVRDVYDSFDGERAQLLIKGEKIGFEKGFEAGRGEAREELRQSFVIFLEEQLRLLKNGLPSPAPASPQTKKVGKFIGQKDEDGFVRVEIGEEIVYVEDED